MGSILEVRKCNEPPGFKKHSTIYTEQFIEMLRLRQIYRQCVTASPMHCSAVEIYCPYNLVGWTYEKLYSETILKLVREIGQKYQNIQT
jgi:hypothetical protein